jgi:homoserine O-acetyltransferase/O-succinyltransferase
VKIRLFIPLFLFVAGVALGQTWPQPVEGDFVINNFKFQDGKVLDRLNLHYATLGTPKRNAQGSVVNAVLIMHGTGGSGNSPLSERFAGQLFGSGQLLDAAVYFIILPDAIGHGKSSKPSNGLKMAFPEYTYDDMVKSTYQLLTEGIRVNHLRLVMGTSMGGMLSWVWGYTYPDFMDAIMPLASLPVEIAGRNRMLRIMAIDAIKNDPGWNMGNYTVQPAGLLYANYALFFMTSSPLQLQKVAPTREQAENYFHTQLERNRAAQDANDLIYQFNASRFYNPSPHLNKIIAPLIAINSADDQVNPPELGILEKEITKVKNGRYILLPITDETRGHGTHSIAKIWSPHLGQLLTETQ